MRSNNHLHGGFTLIELLAVIAIIALLGSLLLPALSKAKTRTHKVRCLANLRQLGIGLQLYTDDNSEKFPFTDAMTPNGWSRTGFIDFYTLTQPYIPTNRQFYLCPVDRGPFNFQQAKNAGLKTNQLPVASSYWLAPGLYTFVKGNSWSPKQRTVTEVLYPSQKVSLLCMAIPSAKAIVNGGFVYYTAHSTPDYPGSNCGFVDGHSAFVSSFTINLDPRTSAAGQGWNWSDPSWQDLR
jgi:prepilin-type N-terminal cleavage/methylation domain-containing protein